MRGRIEMSSTDEVAWSRGSWCRA